MQNLPIKTTLADLKFHFSTIGKIEKNAEAKGHRNRILGIVGLTIVYAVIMLSASAVKPGLIAWFSVIVSLAWIFFIGYYLWYNIKHFRKKILINQLIDENLNTKEQHFLSYDTDRIILKKENQKLEFNWEHFVAFFETDNAIFLFPEGPLYSGMAFTESEIGKQNVEELKNIAKNKLNRISINFT